MKLEQVARLLTEDGCLISYQDGIIKEEPGAYSNYHELKKEDSEWVMNLIIVERQNEPIIKEIERFTNEDEAGTYFYMDRLSSYCSKKYVRAFIRENEEFEIGTSLFGMEELKLASEKIGSQNCLSVDEDKLVQRSVMVKGIGEKLFQLYFINHDLSRVEISMPLDKEDAFFYAFTNMYLLYLLKLNEMKLLDQNEISNVFLDRDYMQFID
ncbi:hypothetical protein [Listeria rustica]|uniref:Uncharacterized protein n=1 Tax=Listeria rustica TaxID=2713503 RepID=A0A7W1T8R4_9LIST|nr:hypothetical protein [Listeria rustica]MBA3927530.1 hypothetical protein [Listeria rustica]